MRGNAAADAVVAVLAIILSQRWEHNVGFSHVIVLALWPARTGGGSVAGRQRTASHPEQTQPARMSAPPQAERGRGGPALHLARRSMTVACRIAHPLPCTSACA